MLADVLTELAHSTPSLPGARCKGREELFDRAIPQTGQRWNHPDVVSARKAAKAVCADCGALQLCAEWTNSLPQSQRPRGVVGGQLTHGDGRRFKVGRAA